MPSPSSPGRVSVLYAVAMILVLLWLVGLLTSATLGGFIHVLLLVAVIIVLLRVISGRRAV
jgi:hypothetical protein